MSSISLSHGIGHGIGHSIGWDAGVAAIALVLALGWLLGVQRLSAHYRWSSALSRKIVHTGTGPLFVLCWPLFSDRPSAAYWASVVPLSLTLVFLLVGLGWVRKNAMVMASARSGDPKELLKGPLYYGIAFVLCTIVFWRTSPVGMLALMVLCGGDGLADMVGRRWGTHKLPFSPDKSWIGSFAMFLGSVAFGLGAVLLFNALGYFQPELVVGQTVITVMAIALIATLVEAIPVADIDNLTLVGTVVGLGLWWF